MSLVIALDFFALVDLFRLRVYRGTAGVALLFSPRCSWRLPRWDPDARLVLTGAGFGNVLWATSRVLRLYSENLAAGSGRIANRPRIAAVITRWASNR